MNTNIPIFDCHIHFVDTRDNTYPVFESRNEFMESLVGDYSEMPRIYHYQNYLADTSDFNVTGMLIAEMVSNDALKEATWLNKSASKLPAGVMAEADFSSDTLSERLEHYASLPAIKTIRQHMGFSADDLSVSEHNLFADPAWLNGITQLGHYPFICELEIFSPQLPAFTQAIQAFPNQQFVLPAFGWPLDLSQKGFKPWEADMTALSKLPNIIIKIFALECIFGLHWTVEQVAPWVLKTIELFGVERCLFGSHFPIAKLSRSFSDLYSDYFKIITDYSRDDQRKLFHDNAHRYYGIP